MTYRMRNISAVLEERGHARIEGYAPAGNVGPRVRNQLLQFLGAEGYLDPEDYKASAAPSILAKRARLIRHRGLVSAPRGNLTPVGTSAARAKYLRDPAVIAWVLELVAGRCELCARILPSRIRRTSHISKFTMWFPWAAKGPTLYRTRRPRVRTDIVGATILMTLKRLLCSSIAESVDLRDHRFRRDALLQLDGWNRLTPATDTAASSVRSGTSELRSILGLGAIPEPLRSSSLTSAGGG